MKEIGKSQHTKVQKLYIAYAIFLVISAVISYTLYTAYQNVEPLPATQNAQQKRVQEPPKPEIIELEGRYLFNGTIVVSRAVEDQAVDANGNRDYSQPFSKLYTFQPELYDAQYADFECPITDQLVTLQQSIQTLVFNCPKEFLAPMTDYITLINLANNHTGDRGGQAGLNETRRNIEAYEDKGVQHFGHYDPAITEDICEVIALPMRVQKDDGSEVPQTMPIAFCAWHFFNYGSRQPTEAELDEARKYSAIMPVFAFVEMGAEYQAVASDSQRQTARAIIDAGAEFVFANNPHWVQDSEVYNGKLIVYSLGNFIFDQIEPETRRGVSIDATVTIPYTDNVQAWLDLARTCDPVRYKDTCLEEAQAAGLDKVGTQFIYDPVANINGFRDITRKADEATQKAVEERLLWSETLEQLNQQPE